VRRAVATLTILAALVIGATATAGPLLQGVPFLGTYSGPAHGQLARFTLDHHGDVRDFTWGDRHIFDRAGISRQDGVWGFHIHTEKWQVHGHWTTHKHVDGTICVLDANFVCPITRPGHLIHFSAELH
jgi:hypothetical protein